MTIIGRDAILNFLKKTHAKEKMPHALLFWGRRHSGKGALALAVAQTLACRKGIFLGCGECEACRDGSVLFNAHCIRPVSLEDNEDALQNIGIDAMRDALQKIASTSLVGMPYVVIIERAETLTGEAASILLKTLEEPPQNVYFVLTAETKDAILPTIASRAVAIRLPAVEISVFEKYLAERYSDMSEAERGVLARFAQGLPGKFFAGLGDPLLIKDAQRAYSEAYALLSLPPYQSFQLVEKMLAAGSAPSDAIPRFFAILRTLFLGPRTARHTFALKIPDAFVKKFEERYTKERYLQIFSSLFRTHTLLSTTNVNQRLAFENFLLEL